MSDHIEVICGACEAVVCFPPARYRELKRTHETWYCPNGHPRAWLGKSDEEKRIEELERQVAALERSKGWLAESLQYARTVCRWPGCWRKCATETSLRNHFIRAHGAPTRAQIAVAELAAEAASA